jgi:peroxiredoxin Q/BCP
MPDVGDLAPDFNALDQNRERFFLSKAVKNGKVLLVFYPGDDTPVCSSQLADYRDHLEEFKKLGVQICGISITHYESQKAFAEKLALPFKLLNDYDFRITQKYGVMSFTGHPNRALFLIGEDRSIRYKHVELLPVFRRSSEELLELIKPVLPGKSAAS